MSEGFDASVRHEGDVAVVELRGLIDGSAEARLQEAYASAEATGARVVLLNFGGVTYINSTGIALVVGVLAQARRSQREVRACELTDHYREIFEITRLADFMGIYSDEPSAIAAGA